MGPSAVLLLSTCCAAQQGRDEGVSESQMPGGSVSSNMRQYPRQIRIHLMSRWAPHAPTMKSIAAGCAAADSVGYTDCAAAGGRFGFMPSPRARPKGGARLMAAVMFAAVVSLHSPGLEAQGMSVLAARSSTWVLPGYSMTPSCSRGGKEQAGPT